MTKDDMDGVIWESIAFTIADGGNERIVGFRWD
jgi:hypothetical protein